MKLDRADNERFDYEVGRSYRGPFGTPAVLTSIVDRGQYVELSTGDCIPWSNIRSFRF